MRNELEALLTAYRDTKSEDDFAAIVSRYQRVLGWLISRVGVRDVDDVMQQTWIRVIQRIDEYDPKKSSFTWLRNHLMDEANNHLKFRGRKIRQFVKADLTCVLGNSLSGDERIEQGESHREVQEYARRVIEYVEGCPGRVREITLLRLQNWPLRSIAAITGTNRHTVSTIVSRMRKTIRELFGPQPEINFRFDFRHRHGTL